MTIWIILRSVFISMGAIGLFITGLWLGVAIEREGLKLRCSCPMYGKNCYYKGRLGGYCMFKDEENIN